MALNNSTEFTITRVLSKREQSIDLSFFGDNDLGFPQILKKDYIPVGRLTVVLVAAILTRL